MSQSKSQNFDGFRGVKSEHKVQSGQIWLQMKGLEEIHHIKVFQNVLEAHVILKMT